MTDIPFDLLMVLVGSQVYCCKACHRASHRWGSTKRCLNICVSCCPHPTEYNHTYMCEGCRKELYGTTVAVAVAVTPVSPVTPIKKTPSHSLQWQIKSAKAETSPNHKQMHRTTLKRQRDRLDRMLAYNHTVTKRIRLPGAGRKTLLGALELKIVEWIKNQRANCIQVEAEGIISQAVALAGDTEFAASDGWFCGFKKRHNIVIRMVTSYSRKYTDAQLDEKQREYVTTLIQEIESKDVSSTYIFNMDETPIFKDSPPKRTYDLRGAKVIPMFTTNHVKDRLTLVLCVSILGVMHPPLIIFKSEAKDEPLFVKEVDSRGRVLWHCGQPNAYNSGEIMKKWIENIFLPNRNIPADAASMLTMDNVSFHLNPECAAALSSQKIVVNTFPPNTTCRLQPLDHSINGIVKRKFTSSWTKWMRRANPAKTVHGNLQQPQRDQIKQWVLDAIDGVKPESIRRSFRHCWPSLMALSD
jgi:hypothetical protein